MNITYANLNLENTFIDRFTTTNQTEILISLNYNKKTIERKVYSLVDWMNEVGGFAAYI